jgi:4-hydroxy-4-methyl-2-oxoglutarate aldolase
MFDIRSMPEQIAQETLAKAMSVEPATLGHFRLTGFPASRIRPLASAKKAVGTAVTLALPGADSTLLHHTVGLLRRGDILLIDRWAIPSTPALAAAWPCPSKGRDWRR